MNCQSVSPKRGEFQNLVDSTQPDIVVATETWLAEGKHQDGEIGEVNRFSVDYKIYRKDRQDGYGGVFVAVRNDIISERADDLETNAEMVWVKIKIKGMKTLYVAGYYRPHENDEESHEEFKLSLEKIAAHPQAHLWICGDMNFPGIDWVSKDLKPTSRFPLLHQDFLDCLAEYGLQQMVKEPTREENILDLFITNNISKVNKVQVIPGISDHDAVLVEGDLSPASNKQQKRQVPMYKKAQWNALKEHVKQFGNNLNIEDKSMSVNTLWLEFKGMLENGIKKYIPHRTAKKKDSLPWITSSIKKLLKKRDCMYIKSKKTGKEQDRKAFQALKHQAQKQLRQAYWAYVKDMIFPEVPDTDTQKQVGKNFCTYVKHCKQDSSGVAPLLGDDGTRTDDPKGKAEILNKQFTSVFSKATPLTLAQSAKRVLREHSPLQGNHSSPHPSMPDFNITSNGVNKLLKNLKPHKLLGQTPLNHRY